MILKLSGSDLFDPPHPQVWNQLVFASLDFLKPLCEEADFLVELLVAQFADALGRAIVELEIDHPFVLLRSLVLFLVVFVLVALAVLSSPFFLLGPIFRLFVFLSLRLALEEKVFLLALLVIALNVLDDILKLFHWLLLEALVAEVTGGHVDATTDVQVVHCHSFKAILLLLSPLLSQAVLAVRVCVMSHQMLLHQLLSCHLLWLFLLRLLLILLEYAWKLVCHSHAIKAIGITFMAFYTVRVYKLRRFLKLLLFCKF